MFLFFLEQVLRIEQNPIAHIPKNVISSGSAGEILSYIQQHEAETVRPGSDGGREGDEESSSALEIVSVQQQGGDQREKGNEIHQSLYTSVISSRALRSSAGEKEEIKEGRDAEETLEGGDHSSFPSLMISESSNPSLPIETREVAAEFENSSTEPLLSANEASRDQLNQKQSETGQQTSATSTRWFSLGQESVSDLQQIMSERSEDLGNREEHAYSFDEKGGRGKTGVYVPPALYADSNSELLHSFASQRNNLFGQPGPNFLYGMSKSLDDSGSVDDSRGTSSNSDHTTEHQFISPAQRRQHQHHPHQHQRHPQNQHDHPQLQQLKQSQYARRIVQRVAALEQSDPPTIDLSSSSSAPYSPSSPPFPPPPAPTAFSQGNLKMNMQPILVSASSPPSSPSDLMYSLDQSWQKADEFERKRKELDKVHEESRSIDDHTDSHDMYLSGQSEREDGDTNGFQPDEQKRSGRDEEGEGRTKRVNDSEHHDGVEGKEGELKRSGRKRGRVSSDDKESSAEKRLKYMEKKLFLVNIFVQYFLLSLFSLLY